MKKLLFLLPLLFVFSGCVESYSVGKSIDEIILRENFYTTEKGKALAVKYRDRLKSIANRIRTSFHFSELEFFNTGEMQLNAIGLYFGREETDVNAAQIYLCAGMYTTTQYNTLRSNYNSRSATVFTKYARVLFDKLYASGITADENVFGISVKLGWSAKNFTKYQGDWEYITIFAETEKVTQFLNNEITGQDFIKQSRVFGTQGKTYLGLVELDLSERM